jgi:hypothetical protein
MKNNFEFNYQKTSDLSQFLKESKDWLILRLTNDGIHLHCKNENSICLIPIYLIINPDLWDFVKESVLEKKLNKI